MLRFELFSILEDEHSHNSRVTNERINYNLDISAVENFRLTRSQIEKILLKTGAHLQYTSKRNMCLNPLQQLLTTLHWLGNGGQYHGIAKMHGVHKSTVCRVIYRVANIVINEFMDVTIRWPEFEENQNIATQFFNIGGFPQVAGCIDGTMIDTDAPNVNEEQFVNRHGNHAINAMMVCGPNFQIYAVNCNWPGSVHDARVLRNSNLFGRFENGFRPFPNAVILGDSAYPLLNWLIPPLRNNPTSPQEQLFNRAHKKTRRIIENCFGILKEKFPCLNHLRLQPEKAAKIIIMCCTFHNICRMDAQNDVDYDEEIMNGANENEKEQSFQNTESLNNSERLQSLLNWFN
ncbi:putative nuclease HARBI1 isoform X1 [Bactrocera dorsalis]|uniref:Putative nuclease HARBI1 n=1 Tax=Bactrocera dorsalis TaxID=27457 RepID=A0ABM3IYB1_BACDO|nr:putative nuclease HARBI1 isoform X1 [Bactrocera dorsalis]